MMVGKARGCIFGIGKASEVRCKDILTLAEDGFYGYVDREEVILFKR